MPDGLEQRLLQQHQWHRFSMYATQLPSIYRVGRGAISRVYLHSSWKETQEQYRVSRRGTGPVGHTGRCLFGIGHAVEVLILSRFRDGIEIATEGASDVVVLIGAKQWWTSFL